MMLFNVTDPRALHLCAELQTLRSHTMKSLKALQTHQFISL